jgi:hypothetical protein
VAEDRESSMYTKRDYWSDIEKIKEVVIRSGVRVKYWHGSYKDVIQAIVVNREGNWLTVVGNNRRKKKVNLNSVLACWYRGSEIVL